MEKLFRRRPTDKRQTSRHCRFKVSAAMLSVMIMLSGCSLLPIEEDSLQPPLVEPNEEQLNLVEASKGTIQTTLRGTANFVSSKTETLSFKGLGGRIKSVNVALGQKVVAGDLIAEMDTGDLDLQTRLQRLNVERAELFYKQALSAGANEIDLRLREIDLEKERLSLKSMEERLAQSRLYAPFAGIVIFAEQLKTDDFVNAFQSIITIADPESLQLTYAATETKELQALEVGMPANLKYKGVEYTGKVLQTPSSVPPGSDPAKSERNAMTIIIGIDDVPGDVQVGHSAEITIPLQQRENIIILPRSAIRTYMGRNYVQVVDGERRKEVDIEIGLTTSTEVEIVKGIEEGQQVILNN
ncbi:efflux RND transporter periplasmic adaptor subunit [Paenibacillus sp. LHD-117]|uniref:efflux RND transporter periplasmic adaptor subunit n=1 Tax=Paenibacillus sp. LHD-117 TaxID=3071412 RepID=UPI0027E09E0D|nr:efflux RND transporter periplasmic adaptor subunit [Paenibacillus sp. LHD-117]MDQ6417860.1 efflux RND transporter periplasmic adaptor subunit [Paenibacillus sp. LHD-117]